MEADMEAEIIGEIIIDCSKSCGGTVVNEEELVGEDACATPQQTSPSKATEQANQQEGELLKPLVSNTTEEETETCDDDGEAAVEEEEVMANPSNAEAEAPADAHVEQPEDRSEDHAVPENHQQTKEEEEKEEEKEEVETAEEMEQGAAESSSEEEDEEEQPQETMLEALEAAEKEAEADIVPEMKESGSRKPKLHVETGLGGDNEGNLISLKLEPEGSKDETDVDDASTGIRQATSRDPDGAKDADDSDNDGSSSGQEEQCLTQREHFITTEQDEMLLQKQKILADARKSLEEGANLLSNARKNMTEVDAPGAPRSPRKAAMLLAAARQSLKDDDDGPKSPKKSAMQMMKAQKSQKEDEARPDAPESLKEDDSPDAPESLNKDDTPDAQPTAPESLKEDDSPDAQPSDASESLKEDSTPDAQLSDASESSKEDDSLDAQPTDAPESRKEDDTPDALPTDAPESREEDDTPDALPALKIPSIQERERMLRESARKGLESSRSSENSNAVTGTPQLSNFVKEREAMLKAYARRNKSQGSVVPKAEKVTVTGVKEREEMLKASLKKDAIQGPIAPKAQTVAVTGVKEREEMLKASLKKDAKGKLAAAGSTLDTKGKRRAMSVNSSLDTGVKAREEMLKASLKKDSVRKVGGTNRTLDTQGKRRASHGAECSGSGVREREEMLKASLKKDAAWSSFGSMAEINAAVVGTPTTGVKEREEMLKASLKKDATAMRNSIAECTGSGVKEREEMLKASLKKNVQASSSPSAEELSTVQAVKSQIAAYNVLSKSSPQNSSNNLAALDAPRRASTGEVVRSRMVDITSANRPTPTAAMPPRPSPSVNNSALLKKHNPDLYYANEFNRMVDVDPADVSNHDGIDFETVLEIVEAYPKVCKAKYDLTFGGEKKKLYPLFSLVANQAPVEVVKAVFMENPFRFLDVRDENGRTLLHYACAYKPLPIESLVYLEKRNSHTLDAWDNKKRSPLHIACAKMTPEVILFILQHSTQAMVATPDANGDLPIDLATKNFKCTKEVKRALRDKAEGVSPIVIEQPKEPPVPVNRSSSQQVATPKPANQSTQRATPIPADQSNQEVTPKEKSKPKSQITNWLVPFNWCCTPQTETSLVPFNWFRKETPETATSTSLVPYNQWGQQATQTATRTPDSPVVNSLVLPFNGQNQEATQLVARNPMENSLVPYNQGQEAAQMAARTAVANSLRAYHQQKGQEGTQTATRTPTENSQIPINGQGQEATPMPTSNPDDPMATPPTYKRTDEQVGLPITWWERLCCVPQV